MSLRIFPHISRGMKMTTPDYIILFYKMNGLGYPFLYEEWSNEWYRTR